MSIAGLAATGLVGATDAHATAASTSGSASAARAVAPPSEWPTAATRERSRLSPTSGLTSVAVIAERSFSGWSIILRLSSVLPVPLIVTVP